MVKRQFQNLKLQCWEHKGRLGMSPPFLCLQGDAVAAGALLSAIDELAQEGPSGRRTVTLESHSRPLPVFALKIILVPVSDDLRQMSLTRKGTTAMLEFTPFGLEEFRRAATLWKDGGEDFSLHSEGSRKARVSKRKSELGGKDLASGELWFWTTMDP